MRSWQICLNPFDSPNEVYSIIVVLFHTSSYGKHVRVEYYIERVHTHLLCEELVGTSGYFNASFVSSGLSYFVETHHHYSSTIAHHVASVTQEHLFAFFQRDRVDDTLTLHTLQSGSYHVPFRRVNHHRHLGNVGFRSYDIQEGAHFLTCVKQSVVHVNVNHKRSICHLLACYAHSLVVALLLDKSKEFARTSHIASLAHIDKAHIGRNVEQFQSAQPHSLRLGLRHVRLLAFGYWHILGNEFLGSTAASAYDVHQSLVYEFLYLRSHRLGSLVVCAQTVGQSGVGIGAYIIRCTMSQLLQERLHLVGTKRAVESDREDRIAAHTCQHSIECLSAQSASGKVAYGDAQHYWQVFASTSTHLHCCINSSLCIERVKDSLN